MQEIDGAQVGALYRWESNGGPQRYSSTSTPLAATKTTEEIALPGLPLEVSSKG